MRDTSVQAAIAVLAFAKRTNPDCDGSDMTMSSSRVISENEDLGPDIYGVRYTGSWSESWRFAACGNQYDVPVSFTADGDGGAYTNIAGGEITLVEREPA